MGNLFILKINSYNKVNNTRTRGLAFNLFHFKILFSHVKATIKGDYFDGKKIGISNYKRKGAKGISFFLFQNAIFILIDNEKGDI